MGTSIDTPPPQNYGTQMADTLKAQAEMESGTGRFASIGPRIDLERKYSPQYQQLTIDNLKAATPQLLSLYNQVAPQLSDAENASRMASRTGDIQSIEQLGPRARAAMAAANPGQAGLVDTLTSNAQKGLDAGGTLTADQRRGVQQDSRAAFAARGLATSPSAGLYESVRSQLAQQGVMQQRQANAGQALAAGQSFYGDPFQQILGRPSQAFGASGAALQGAQGFNPGAIFNPESALSANISNNNYQGTLAANTANAANSTALIGAGIKGATSAAGSL